MYFFPASVHLNAPKLEWQQLPWKQILSLARGEKKGNPRRAELCSTLWEILIFELVPFLKFTFGHWAYYSRLISWLMHISKNPHFKYKLLTKILLKKHPLFET